MQPIPVKAVLFDLDDTLWPIEPVIRHAEAVLHAWLHEHAPEVAQAHSIDHLRARSMALMEADPRYRIDLWSLRQTGLQEAFRAVGADVARVEAAMAVFATARNAVTPWDDVIPSLQRLSRHVALGTISNGFADLHTIGLAAHFRVSLAAHRFGSAKPDAAIFHAACAALEVAPEQTVYVGDDPLLDVQGAQNAGLRAVWMNRFGRSLPPYIRPDGSCTSLLELEEWIAHRIMLAGSAAAG